MRIASVLLLYAGLVVTGCTNTSENKSQAENKRTAQPPKSRLDSAGTQQLLALLTDYYALKDALVATNAQKADAAAAKLAQSAANMSAVLQTSGNSILQPHLDTIKAKTQDIIGMMDESCEHKRIHFEAISNTMYALLQKTELKNAGVYRQYCPMAFNDKGAYWLSNEADIKNPYFGDKMLECGEVTDTLN